MTNINKTLGQVIAKYRKIANISQEELADRTGIHRTYVSQIERGLKSPTLSILFEISKSLNTTASSLIAEVEQNIDDLYH
ncbi:MAG: helix-turn-helix transcriptional regulator [Lyngbya sp.]|nr:helix-turn-helix transcriptional regulator [Lyngbya sp.]